MPGVPRAGAVQAWRADRSSNGHSTSVSPKRDVRVSHSGVTVQQQAAGAVSLDALAPVARRAGDETRDPAVRDLAELIDRAAELD